MLEIDHLTKRFGTKTAVQSATFTVEKPAMIGIIGRSGAGKSTLLRMINRLTAETEGKIVFEGEDVTALKGASKRRWQSECAMIFQQFNLVPRMDVVSNVLHGTLNRRSTFTTLFNLYPDVDISQGARHPGQSLGRDNLCNRGRTQRPVSGGREPIVGRARRDNHHRSRRWSYRHRWSRNDHL